MPANGPELKINLQNAFDHIRTLIGPNVLFDIFTGVVESIKNSNWNCLLSIFIVDCIFPSLNPL